MPNAAAPPLVERPRSAARAVRGYALGLLLVIYTLNIVDRKILAILQEAIKADFKLADWQLGLLTGFAFALLYTVVGLPVARLADRGVSRVNIISAALAVWSGMTALCGAAQSFAQLLLARIGVGIGESGCTPPALSLLSDYYPRVERGRAMGIYSLGLPLGTAAGLGLGGWLAQSIGWRGAMMAVGLPGLACALLLRFTVAEPRRGDGGTRPAADAAVPLGTVLRTIFASRTYVMLLVASSIAAFCTLGLQFWFPSFFIRTYGLSMAEVGLWWGLAAGFCGLLGSFGGGWLADRTGARNPRNILLVPALALLLAMPCQILAATAHNFALSLIFLLVPTTVNNLWMAPNMLLTQSLVPAPMRAMSSAISTFLTNIVGLGIGPMLLGLASDWFGRGDADPATGLRDALIAAAAVYIPAAILFIVASRSIAADLRD